MAPWLSSDCALDPSCNLNHHSDTYRDSRFPLTPVGRYHEDQQTYWHDRMALLPYHIYGVTDFLWRAQHWITAEKDRLEHKEQVEKGRVPQADDRHLTYRQKLQRQTQELGLYYFDQEAAEQFSLANCPQMVEQLRSDIAEMIRGYRDNMPPLPAWCNPGEARWCE